MAETSTPTLDEAQETLLRAAIANMDQPCFNACKVLFDELARLSTPPEGSNGEDVAPARPVVDDSFPKEPWMTDAQIKHMVDRFLCWRLPENFRPDAGISFKPTFNEHTAWPMKHEPTGTNLLDAAQATEMVRNMVEGMTVAPTEPTDRSLGLTA